MVTGLYIFIMTGFSRNTSPLFILPQKPLCSSTFFIKKKKKKTKPCIFFVLAVFPYFSNRESTMFGHSYWGIETAVEAVIKKTTARAQIIDYLLLRLTNWAHPVISETWGWCHRILWEQISKDWACWHLASTSRPRASKHTTDGDSSSSKQPYEQVLSLSLSYRTGIGARVVSIPPKVTQEVSDGQWLSHEPLWEAAALSHWAELPALISAKTARFSWQSLLPHHVVACGLTVS